MSKPLKLVSFLEVILPPDEEGWLALGWIDNIWLPPKEQGYHQQFIIHPDLFGQICEFVEEHKGKDCYFSPLLFGQKFREKEYAQPGAVLWADLDDCRPEWLGKYGEPSPNLLVHTSAEHWQAYWLLTKSISAEAIEELNRRIVYGYRREGMDFGWSRTKIMRLPTTFNNKRDEPFKVEAVLTKKERCTVKDFEGLPKPKVSSAVYTRPVLGHETIADIDADKLAGVSQRIIDLIKTGWTPGCRYKSRSEAEFAVMVAMFSAGYTEEEIRGILWKYPIGSKFRGEPKNDQ
jgi:hypothetical protein